MAQNNELCLIGEGSWQYMTSNFDHLTCHQRDLRNNARFNICPTCFGEWGSRLDYHSPATAEALVQVFEYAIENQITDSDRFEALIRRRFNF